MRGRRKQPLPDPGPAPYSLDVVAGPAQGSRIVLSKPLTLGRDQEGEGRLQGDPELSRQHARIELLPGRGLLLEDLGSSNGTFVNGSRIPAPTLIGSDDEISLGQTRMRLRGEPEAPLEPDAQLVDPPTGTAPPPPAPVPQAGLRVVAGSAPGTIIPLGEGPLLLGGRGAAAAALAGDPAVEAEHARVCLLADGRLLVEDLGSRTGTLVEGRAIPAPTLLRPGERFSLGGSTLELAQAASLLPSPSGGAVRARGGVQPLPEGLFALIGLRAPVQREQVLPVFALALGWGIAASLLVRSAAIELADVPDDLSSLRYLPLLVATVVPIAANAFGFSLIFRRPDDRSVKRYLLPTFGVPLLFLVVNLIRLNHDGARELVTTVIVTIQPLVICAALMLRLRARVARGRVAALRARSGPD